MFLYYYIPLSISFPTPYSKLFYGKKSGRYDENKTFRGKFALEIFVGLEKPPEKTHRCTGKKYQNIYVYLPRYRVAQRLFDGKFVETLNSVHLTFLKFN